MPDSSRMGSVITLTTDFGISDAYVASMKGVILSTNHEAKIVDITHSIEPQNITQAAFILHVTHRHFPKQTIHVAIVDPGVGGERQGIILKTPSALFVAPDNGILSYIILESAVENWEIESRLVASPLPRYFQTLREVKIGKGLEAIAITDPRFWRHPVSYTFHGRDVFAPVAAALSLDISPYEFGERITFLHVFPTPKPFIDPEGNLIGHILYIDHFGNLITDIKNTDIPYGDVIIEVTGQRIQGISRYYEEGEGLIAIPGSSGYLEISLKNGNACDFLDVSVGDEIVMISSHNNWG